MKTQQLARPWQRGRGVIYGTLLALAIGLPAPAAAEAQPPRITERPVVAGTPQVGTTLAAQGAEWDGRPEPLVTWQWVRCDGPGADTRSCRAIDGATKTSYTVAEADEGKRLRVLLTVRNEDGWAWALTSATAEVEGAPAEPAPAPSPEPEPAPSPAPPAPVPASTAA